MKSKRYFVAFFVALLLAAASGTAWAAEVTASGVNPSSLTIGQNDSGTFDAQITSIFGRVPPNNPHAPTISYCSEWVIHNDGTITCSETSIIALTPARNYTTNPLTSPLNGAVTVNVDPEVPCIPPNNVYTIPETLTANEGSGVNFGNDLLEVTHFVTVTVSCSAATSDGCSHGFWKNHFESWPAAYAGDPTLGSVFTMGAAYSTIQGDNFSDALGASYGGGPTLVGMAGSLMKQAVAAVLNAAHSGVNYPISDPSDVIDEVNTALADGAAAGTVQAGRAILEAEKDRLDDFNKGVCLLPDPVD